jgi:aminoglycoside 6'-N-acetyltransferase
VTELRGDIVVLRPLRFDDAVRLREIHAEPSVAAWWGSMDDEFPFDEPDSTRFTIWVDGDVAGLVQFWEEDEPDYRHAGIDLFVASAFQGRGVGTDTVRRMVRHLVDDYRHHRITIDPAVDNVAAIRAYEKAGFRRIGVMELAERASDGRWRNSLFMEQVFPEVAGITKDERPS